MLVWFIGDNIQTALSVAKECGIIDKNENVIDVVAGPLKYGKPTVSFKVTELNRGVSQKERSGSYPRVKTLCTIILGKWRGANSNLLMWWDYDGRWKQF